MQEAIQSVEEIPMRKTKPTPIWLQLAIDDKLDAQDALESSRRQLELGELSTALSFVTDALVLIDMAFGWLEKEVNNSDA